MVGNEPRIADKNRGNKKFPHWHDSKEWAKRTTMTRSRFLSMTPDEFADWIFFNYHSEDVLGFFYGSGWPEGHSYCGIREYAINAYKGLKDNINNWPTSLIDTDEEYRKDY